MHLPLAFRSVFRLSGLVLTVTLGAFHTGLAAPGDLDPSFGVNGKVTTFWPNGGSADPRGYPSQIAVQADGRIVVAGKASTNGHQDDFALARYNPNGTLDTSFGGGGTVRTDFFGHGDEAAGVVVQPDGKIVAGGRAVIQFINNSADSGFALVRYNPDGSLDQSFGTGGKVITNFRSSLDDGQAMALQPDGKIVLAGFVTQGENNGALYDFAVVRYNPDGSVDTDFGVGGIMTTDFAGSGDRAYAVTIQPDGKIVLAGVAYMPSTGADFALARYNPNGTIDLSFNGTGTVTTNFAGNFEDFGHAMALAPDGKIVVAGWARNSSTYTARADYAVARYNQNGTLDTSFNGTGRWTADISGDGESDYARGVAVQQNGKIVVVGTSPLFRVTGGSHVNFGVLRLEPNGTFDSAWPNGGKVFTDFSEFYPHISGDSAETVLILPDGRIVVAGTATPERYRFDWAIARYAGDPIPTAPTATRVVSRKMHNGVPFDIELPLTGRGIECRSTGEHQIVFSFASPVSVQGASVQGSGSVNRYATSGSEVIVDLVGVENAQTVTVQLNGVNNGSATGDVSVRIGFLRGDVNGSGVVNASDVSQTKAESGQTLSASNFRSDVNLSGATNATDLSIVKSQTGATTAP
jgi:uncharacterized delta-60 repeat protein